MLNKDEIKGGCILAVGAGVFCVLCVGGCFALSKVEYSDGFRDGTVQKLSRKGVIFKTFEGEMILGGLDFKDDGTGGGTLNRQSFLFSVSDPKVIAELEALPTGKKVRLYYRQTTATWQPSGGTSYFITSVEELPK